MANQEPKIKTHDYIVPTSSTGSTTTIRISEPNLTSENLGLETWASSHILASQLHHLSSKITFPSSSNPSNLLPVLELGAGTGLVGISAATLWSQDVVLTDLAPIVPGLEANIALNEPGLQEAKAVVKAGTLDWMQPTHLSISEEKQSQTAAHVILIADCIYSEEHPELLSNVALKWLTRDKQARLIIAYPLRVCYLDEIREMWSRLEEGGLEACEESRPQTGSRHSIMF